MVSFFFYAILAFLVMIAPLFVKVEGSFSLNRKLIFFVIKIIGIKVATIRIFFDETEGILLSINGKKAKSISSNEEKGHSPPLLSLISAIRITKFELDVYASGEPQTLSLLLGMVQVVTDEVFSYLKVESTLDDCQIRILPCYVSDQLTVKFSISLFTAPALILSALAHTTRGENNAKPNNRKYNE